jgi:hypothetical protein
MLILGDFNITEFASCSSGDLKLTALYNYIDNLMNFYCLKQLNNVTNHNNRLLDLVFSNACNECWVSRSHEPFVSEDLHHPALEIELVASKARLRRLSSASDLDYNFRKCNFNLLYESLLNVDWSFLDSESNVERAVSQFYSVLYQTFQMYVPKKSPSLSREYPTWFTMSIIKGLRKKDAARRRYNSTKSADDYNHFRSLRSSIKSEIKIAYSQYLQHVNKSLKQNPKSFWSFVKSKRDSNAIPSEMLYGNKNLSDPNEIADAFADYFAQSFINNNSNSRSYIQDGLNLSLNANIISITSVTEDDVIKAFKQLKPKLTTGPDKIPAFIVRDCMYVFVRPLTRIFNLILNSGKFPSQWKTSRICPVYKKGEKSDINNYRPIAIICNFAKIFELLLHTFFHRHVSRTLSPHQHGFMKGRSVETNLVSLTQFLAEALNENKQVDVIYTDFSKAFDRIDHQLLLHKLDRFGFSDQLIK